MMHSALCQRALTSTGSPMRGVTTQSSALRAQPSERSLGVHPGELPGRRGTGELITIAATVRRRNAVDPLAHPALRPLVPPTPTAPLS